MQVVLRAPVERIGGHVVAFLLALIPFLTCGASTHPLYELPEIQGAVPDRSADLVARQETTFDGHKVRLRAYNGKIPGPLIEARPGDTLRIRLKNSLPPYDSSAWTATTTCRTVWTRP